MKTNLNPKWLWLLFLACSSLMSNAQETSTSASALEGQFDYILNKSEKYKEVTVVKTAWLQNLKQQVTASYDKLEQELSHSKAMITEQQLKMTTLQNKMQQTSKQLSAYTNTGPTVTFLGITFNQIVFGTLFSILFFGSLILACIWAIKFNKANEIAKNAQHVVVDLEEEYQEYKRRAIEREQKVSRLLQDEINKQKPIAQMKVS